MLAVVEERPGVWRMDEAQFMGVVKAIAGEVEREQNLTRGELLGASYIQCKRLLPKYDPKMCSTFARYAYLHVKTSLTRDVTRDRRASSPGSS